MMTVLHYQVQATVSTKKKYQKLLQIMFITFISELYFILNKIKVSSDMNIMLKYL